MNTKCFLAAFVIVLAFAQVTVAEIVQIPLTGLLGSYPAVRTATFQLPDEPIIVRGAALKLSGEAIVGADSCEWGGPYPWPTQFNARFLDTPGGTWYASGGTPELSGPFETNSSFYALLGDPTWDFLADGQGELTLFGGPYILVGLCWEITQPLATVADAVLFVDADFPVPAEPTSWGRIKALFD